MKYLIDADWVIDALHKRRSAADSMLQLSPDGIAIAWTTVGELLDGAYGHANPPAELDALDFVLGPMQKFGIDEAVVHRFAQIRVDLKRRGMKIPDLDILMAATALEHDLVLLTRNLRHLGRIHGLRIYAGDAPE